jgi:hypothetical protein
MPDVRWCRLNRIVTVITPDDLERYLRATHAAQSIDALREDFPRWADRLQELGAGSVPLALGSTSAWHVDLWANQASDQPAAKRMAHQQRDTMPHLRPYKG